MKVAAATLLLLINTPSLLCSSFQFPSSNVGDGAVLLSSRHGRNNNNIIIASPPTTSTRASLKFLAASSNSDDNDEPQQQQQRKVIKPPQHRTPSASNNNNNGVNDVSVIITTTEEQQLQQAMEELRLAQEEATKYENELASLLLLEAEIAASAAVAAMAAATEAEEAAAATTAVAAIVTTTEDELTLLSMANAYQEALDAANDNINILNTQVLTLEVELANTITAMECTVEDKERIGAEYAYLAKNYGELLSNSKKDVEAAEVAEAVDNASLTLLNEEINIYQTHITNLTTQLSNVESTLLAAQIEATKWSQMTNDAKLREEEYNKELSTAQTRVNELLALQEKQQENNNIILSLREALNATRDEMRNEKEKSKEMEKQLVITTNNNNAATAKASTAEIEDVRSRMSTEITTLKNNIQNMQVELKKKEQELQYALQDKVEIKKLMDEIRYV